MNTPLQEDGLMADSVAGQVSRLVSRLFAEQVDKATRDRAETGLFDSALWQQVVNAGLPLMLANEAAGGLGQSWATAYPVLRGLGAWQVPLPLAETMIAAQLLSLAGLPLPDVGVDVGAAPLTVIEQGRGNTLQAHAEGGAILLSGTVHHVPWARHAQAAVVSLAAGQLALLDLRRGPGVTVQPHSNTAGLPSDTLVLNAARCSAVANNPLTLSQPVWTLGALARSVMMVGALEWALEQTVRYAGERIQFGKPIGKNQVIQQNLAVMAGDVAAARMAALVAANDMVHGGPAAVFSTAVAKVRCGEAATRGTGIAHQVHGAIGFTHEHALHFATRRLWAWREEFGSDAWWAAELGRAAIAERAQGFWPALTAKHFAALS